MKEKKRADNKSYRILLLSISVSIVLAVISIGLLSYVIRGISETKDMVPNDYRSHYIFISDEDNEDFWEEVYRSSVNQAEEDGIYVENLKNSLNVGYTDKDLLRVAINSGVDGIIYGGSNDAVAQALINQAVGDDIGVVLLQNDSEYTARQSFIGIGYYEVGQIYASQIAEIMSSNDMSSADVYIYVSSSMSDEDCNVLTLAIEDSFQEKYTTLSKPAIELVKISSRDSFGTEEEVRSALLQDELPDIMVFLSSTLTQCACQALVDLNRVGDTYALGYYVNQTILDSIDKRVLYSTITVETDDMGRLAVKALEEYEEYGYTNSYQPVGIKLIDKAEARRMLSDAEN